MTYRFARSEPCRSALRTVRQGDERMHDPRKCTGAPSFAHAKVGEADEKTREVVSCNLAISRLGAFVTFRAARHRARHHKSQVASSQIPSPNRQFTRSPNPALPGCALRSDFLTF